MRKTIQTFLLLLAATLPAGCDKCINGGKNGVGEPGPGEWQLVFTSRTTREVDLFVDGDKAAVICPTTNKATVGNFPVSACTIIKAHIRESATDCYYSPNCTQDCDSQTCDPDPCLDTEGMGFEGLSVEMTLYYK